MHLESPKNTIGKSSKEVFEFLTDPRNFETLMPDNVEKFEVVNPDTFLFALKGMPEIALRRKEEVPYNKVVLGAASDKLPFTLTAHITELADDKSEVFLSFEGEFNAMMAMMIKSPITNFIGTLSENMSRIG
jgi:hypothetical protein